MFGMSTRKTILRKICCALAMIVTDMTAEGITNTSITQCTEVGLNLDNLVGQGYERSIFWCTDTH